MTRRLFVVVVVFALAASVIYGMAWQARAAAQRREARDREARERDAQKAEVLQLTGALRQRPDDPALRGRLGMAYWAVGELDDAEAAFKEALVAGADASTEMNLVSLLVRRGRFVEAGERTNRLIAAKKGGVPEWLSRLRSRLAASTGAESPPERTVELRRTDGTFVNSIGMVFVEVPGGSFTRGDDRADRPARVISISPYVIGQFEVTAGQFRQFLEETKYASLGGFRLDNADSKVSAYPIAGVSWLDAEAFTIWLSLRERAVYRLPTEAEWELAARGRQGYREPWGNDRGKAQVDGNWRAGFDGRNPLLRPVGSFPRDRSPFGLFDMAGNVKEWCLDEYVADYFTCLRTGIHSAPLTTSA
jgi:formylglycine-generating enzyme required for sulfatase activity